jgi:hypothetical protein
MIAGQKSKPGPDKPGQSGLAVASGLCYGLAHEKHGPPDYLLSFLLT